MNRHLKLTEHLTQASNFNVRWITTERVDRTSSRPSLILRNWLEPMLLPDCDIQNATELRKFVQLGQITKITQLIFGSHARQVPTAKLKIAALSCLDRPNFSLRKELSTISLREQYCESQIYFVNNFSLNR